MHGAGDDKRVAVWDAWTWKEQGRARPLPKGAIDALAFSPRAGAATGAEPCVLLASGERAAVWGMCGNAWLPVFCLSCTPHWNCTPVSPCST
jgi:hypothetical protein